MKNVCIQNFLGPYLVKMQKNTDQKVLKYGHFPHTVMIPVTLIFSSILVTVMIFMLKCGRLGFTLVGLPFLTLEVPTSQNGQTRSNNFLIFWQRIFLVCLTIMWCWHLKGQFSYSCPILSILITLQGFLALTANRLIRCWK